MNEFNVNGFLAYLAYKLPAPFSSPWTRSTVENFVRAVVKNRNTSKDQICFDLSDIMEEVEFGEVAAFVPEESLTKAGIAMRDDVIWVMDLEVMKNGDVFVDGIQIYSGCNG